MKKGERHTLEERLKAAAKREATPEQAEVIIDAFSQESDVVKIADLTGIPVDIVRNTLDDPEIALRALNRKKNLVGIWLAGTLIDRLKEIIEEAPKANHVLSAATMLQEILSTPTEEIVAAQTSSKKTADMKQRPVEEILKDD